MFEIRAVSGKRSRMIVKLEDIDVLQFRKIAMKEFLKENDYETIVCYTHDGSKKYRTHKSKQDYVIVTK